MARFFFNIRYRPGPHGLARDEEGDEFPDPGSARAHALAVARDLIRRARYDTIRDLFDCTFEITDARGDLVLTVAFGEAVPSEAP